MSNNISGLELQIKYKFKDETLVARALTHSSYCMNKKDKALHNNERLEFLGDAFFDAIISEELYYRMPAVEEGTLTKMRAKIVCEETLAECGRKLKIGEYLRMGRGEERSGGRNRDSIVADAMEALIGAIFLDGGYAAAKVFVLDAFGEYIKEALSGNFHKDYKSEIQERVQASSHGTLKYKVTRETGPDHDKVFDIDLLLNGQVIGHGTGKSKKEAERNAAKEALERGDKNVF